MNAQQEQKRAAFAKLRDLQGVPLAILFAMLIERKPVTKNFLAMILQRDKKTIGKSVDFMEFEGYIQRVHYRAWALPSGQLSLPGFEIGLLNASPPALPPGQDQAGGETGVETAASERGKNPLSDGEGARKGKNSPFERGNSPLSGTTTTTVVDTVEEKVAGSRVASERGKNPLSDIREPPQRRTACRAGESNDEIEAALREIRISGRAIGRNMWPKVLACEHVTPHYLGAMAALVNRHPKPKYRNTGFFIHCVLKGDPAPEWCEECDALYGEHERGCSQWANPYLRGCVEDVETGDAQEREDDGEDDEPGVRLAGMRPSEVWQTALGELRLQMTRETFNTWLRPTRFVSYEDDTLVIGVESEYVKEWLGHRLLVTIQRTLNSIVGEPVKVEFVSEGEIDQ